MFRDLLEKLLVIIKKMRYSKKYPFLCELDHLESNILLSAINTDAIKSNRLLSAINTDAPKLALLFSKSLYSKIH